MRHTHFLFRPLAIALTYLLMPCPPILHGISGLFQAKAQADGGCSATQNRIIQNICAPFAPTNDLIQFENDSIRAYLGELKLPASDADLIYRHGRTDLRSEVRAFMLLRMLDFLSKPSRTAHEDAIVNWFRGRVWTLEREQYLYAINELRAWHNDPCRWRPDPDIAKAYDIKYDGATFCGTNATLLTLFQIAPLLPTKAYFLAAGLQNSYGKRIATTPFGAVIQSDIAAKLIAGGSAGAAGAIWAGVVASGPKTFLTLVRPFSRQLVKTVLKTATKALRVGGLASGPGIIIAIAAEVGITAGFKAADAQQVQDDLNAMEALNTSVQQNPPNLEAFAADEEGLYKLGVAFTDATSPEFSSSSTLPSPLSSDPTFQITPQGQATVQEGSAFTYRDWNGDSWSVSASAGWLVHQNGLHKSFSPTIRYVDWAGKQQIATRIGRFFRVAKADVAGNEIDCPEDSNSGTSNPADPARCKSYMSRSIQVRNNAGANVTVAMALEPAFTSDPTVTFTNGTGKLIEISATGGPLPAITLDNAAVLNGLGMTFLSSAALGIPGTARLAFSGPAPDGVYNLTLRATNSAGTTTQSFTIIVATALQFTSPATVNFVRGVFGSFKVRTSGTGPVTITTDRLYLPPGVSFADDHDGTATISGTPNEFIDVSLVCFPACGLVAANSFSTARQPFRINVLSGPEIPFTSGATASTTFTPGVANSFLLRAAPSAGPVFFDMPCGHPNWLTITDLGNGVALLSGMPPKGENSVQQVRVRVELATLKNAAFFDAYCFLNPKNVTVNVVNRPVFTSDNRTFTTAGASTKFYTIATNQTTGTIAVKGNPQGVVFSPFGNGSGNLIMAPSPGTGGTYEMEFSLGGATQFFTLDIFERPAFTGYDTINFPVGTASRFVLPFTGHPRAQTSFSPEGMRITADSRTGWPAAIAFRDTNEFGVRTGTAVFEGTPAAGTEGTYVVSLRADNGVGSALDKVITINVIKPGDINADGSVSCVDVGILRASLGIRINHAGFDNRADVNADGIVDVRDLALVSSRLPTGTRCQ